MRPIGIEGRRLVTETYDAMVEGHALQISVARDAPPRRDPATGTLVLGQPVEVVFVSRGKIGQGMDLLLSNLGIAISRAIQGRDPNTGEAVELQ